MISKFEGQASEQVLRHAAHAYGNTLHANGNLYMNACLHRMERTICGLNALVDWHGSVSLLVLSFAFVVDMQVMMWAVSRCVAPAAWVKPMRSLVAITAVSCAGRFVGCELMDFDCVGGRSVFGVWVAVRWLAVTEVR